MTVSSSSTAISGSKSTTSINATHRSHETQQSRAHKSRRLRDTNSSPNCSPEPTSPIGSSFASSSESSSSSSNGRNSDHQPSSEANSMVNSTSDNDSDDAPQQQQQPPPPSPSHLLGALGPKMQSLLHRTVGPAAASHKTHRRLRSEVGDISWLPMSGHADNNSGGSGGGNFGGQSLKQSQSLLYLRSPTTARRQSGLLLTAKRTKNARMKLFHQRLEKLFNQRLLKQWNENVRLPANPFSDTPEKRRQLELEAIPEPIRNLLVEINARGPSTEGIFRKSPSAKHCKELRQKLESDSQSSIEEFQVTVIASVFKEWLRSLPDCLLMSRLYPQWIDVAKLIEPLQQQQQQKQHQQQQLLQQQQQPAHLPSSNQQASVTHSQLGRHLRQRPSAQPESKTEQQQQPAEQTATATAVADDDRDNGDDSLFDKDQFPNPSLRPSRSSLAATSHQPLDRARSCSTMLTDHQTSSIVAGPAAGGANGGGHVQQVATSNSFTQCNQTERLQEQHQQRPWRSLASFKLSERRSECLRFVRQLLDNLNDSNLVLLRSFMSVLCRIASNSELNKMSASNLGVCVGQSLLNDEQHSSSSSPSKLSGYNFSRRLRRTRSYSILSSTFSHSNPNLKIDTAQETAKYVPVLVTFMIENARQIFGSDIVNLFAATQKESQSLDSDRVSDTGVHRGAASQLDCSRVVSSPPTCSMDAEETISTSDRSDHLPFRFIDQVDSCQENNSSASASLSHLDGAPVVHSQQTQTAPSMRQLLVVNNRPVVLSLNGGSDKVLGQEGAYSSANSSSTSGVHSESPAFSSELDSHHNSRLSDSPRSSVSSPSSMSSSGSSPLQDHHFADHHHSDSEVNSADARLTATTSTKATTTKQDDLIQSAGSAHKQTLPFGPQSCASPGFASATPYHYSSLASSTPKGRGHHRNSLPPNGFSPFMGSSILNRVPKLPVRLSSSNYGGEAIIYNPKPSGSHLDNNNTVSIGSEYCVICPRDLARESSSSMSVRPLSQPPERRQLDHSRVVSVGAAQQQHHGSDNNTNENHKEHRLNQFLAQQQQQRPLPSAAASGSIAQQDKQLGNASEVATQQPGASTVALASILAQPLLNSAQLPMESPIYCYAQHHQHSNNNTELNHPIFSSSANLNSLPPPIQQQQQQYYSSLVCCSHHRGVGGGNFFEPARSHVMSLRDYYLSLQLRQQQQQNSYTLHRHSQLMRQQQQQHQTCGAPNEPQINNQQQLHHQHVLQQQQALHSSSSQYYDHKKPHVRVAQGGGTINCGSTGMRQQQHYKIDENSHFQMAPDSQQLQLQLQLHQRQVAGNHNLAAHQAALTVRKPQTKLARIRQNQFNKPNAQVAASAGRLYVAKSGDMMLSQGGLANKMSVSDNSSGNSSDSSDEFSNEWTESTMV